MLPRPTEVQPRGQFRIWLRYSDGIEGLVDLSHLAGKGVFQTWTEPSSVDSVYIAPHGAIAWGEDIELCPDALYIQVTGMSAEEVKLSRPATVAVGWRPDPLCHPERSEGSKIPALETPQEPNYSKFSVPNPQE